MRFVRRDGARMTYRCGALNGYKYRSERGHSDREECRRIARFMTYYHVPVCWQHSQHFLHETFPIDDTVVEQDWPGTFEKL